MAFVIPKVTHSQESAHYYSVVDEYYDPKLGDRVLDNINKFVSHNWSSNTNDIFIQNKFMPMKQVLKVHQFHNHHIGALVGQHGVLSQSLKIANDTILGCIWCPYYTISAWDKLYKPTIPPWYHLNIWKIGNYMVSPFDHKSNRHLTVWSFVNDFREDITTAATCEAQNKNVNVIFQEFIVTQDIQLQTELVTYTTPMIFAVAIKDIEPHTELVTYYGDCYTDDVIKNPNPTIKPCYDTLYNAKSFPTSFYDLSETKLELIQKPLFMRDLHDVKEKDDNLDDTKQDQNEFENLDIDLMNWNSNKLKIDLRKLQQEPKYHDHYEYCVNKFMIDIWTNILSKQRDNINEEEQQQEEEQQRDKINEGEQQLRNELQQLLDKVEEDTKQQQHDAENEQECDLVIDTDGFDPNKEALLHHQLHQLVDTTEHIFIPHQRQLLDKLQEERKQQQHDEALLDDQLHELINKLQEERKQQQHDEAENNHQGDIVIGANADADDKHEDSGGDNSKLTCCDATRINYQHDEVKIESKLPNDDDDDFQSRQIANGLGIEFTKMKDLPAQVQWDPYRHSYTKLWKAVERLVKKSKSKDVCDDLLSKDMNARQLKDIHRALGCPGSPRGRIADMKPVIINKILEIHNNLRESANICDDESDDDDKEEEIPTVRGQNKYNWLLRKYEIVNNETQKNEIICDDVNESNWDYVKCNNKQNTLLYDCDHYMSKIIDITKNNKQIGLTFWNPALNRCFLELAIHCPDEHAPPGWVQLNKRWLFKFDGRSYPNGHKLKGATAQNAMNKLEKMKYKKEHFTYDNFDYSNEENEV